MPDETLPPAVPRRERVAGVVLAAMVGGYVAVFGLLTWRQQTNYGTFGFDMGLHDQGIWLTSKFVSPFVTVRGMNYYGHHVNLVSVLYAPAYWLGAGPRFLYLTETIALALGAVPLWLLARLRMRSSWLALVPAAAWLLHPSVEWINWWHWHPETMAITPLLFAWWFAVQARWRPFAASVALALLCKEDVALAVLMLGVVIAVVPFAREHASRREVRRAGVLTAVAGGSWFVLCTRVFIPAILGASPFYERTLFPDYGDSMGSILWGMFTNPDRVLGDALEAGRLEYYLQLTGPFGILAVVAALPVVGIAAPQLVVNVLSSLPGTYDIRFQYSSMVLVAVALAAVEGLGVLRALAAGRAGDGRIGAHAARPSRLAQLPLAVAVFTMAVGAVGANALWSPSPLGDEYDTGIWAQRIPRHDVFDQATAMVPDDASVAASYYLIPHLTHRREAYEWPNPWILVNWGLSGEDPPDPDSVDYLVLDRTLDQEPALVASLTGPLGEFDVLLDRDNVLVARRRDAR
ncbi:MAG TPA: DUF2079 domain-containing protein [Acidimicrobiales bacterium]